MDWSTIWIIVAIGAVCFCIGCAWGYYDGYIRAESDLVKAMNDKFNNMGVSYHGKNEVTDD